MNYQYLIFDLDNTLYAKNTGMLKYIDQKIDNFIKEQLNLPFERVTQLREEYWQKYGTTLGGLILHHQTNPQDYIDYAYGIDVKQFIRRDPRLQQLLAQLNCKKVIFSNSPAQYVRAVLNVLGVAEFFDRVYDIGFCDYWGKPNRASYQKVLADLNEKPENCLFIDDVLVNLQGAQAVGMDTVWLTTQPAAEGVKWCIKEIYELKDLRIDLAGRQVSA